MICLALLRLWQPDLEGYSRLIDTMNDPIQSFLVCDGRWRSLLPVFTAVAALLPMVADALRRSMRSRRRRRVHFRGLIKSRSMSRS